MDDAINKENGQRSAVTGRTDRLELGGSADPPPPARELVFLIGGPPDPPIPPLEKSNGVVKEDLWVGFDPEVARLCKIRFVTPFHLWNFLESRMSPGQRVFYLKQYCGGNAKKTVQFYLQLRARAVSSLERLP